MSWNFIKCALNFLRFSTIFLQFSPISKIFYQFLRFFTNFYKFSTNFHFLLSTTNIFRLFSLFLQNLYKFCTITNIISINIYKFYFIFPKRMLWSMLKLKLQSKVICHLLKLWKEEAYTTWNLLWWMHGKLFANI